VTASQRGWGLRPLWTLKEKNNNKDETVSLCLLLDAERKK
jgi:hypothetical protein